MKKKPIKTILKDSQNHPGMLKSEKKGNQPPKNKQDISADIKIILEYSAKKNKTKPTEEYSTLYPETNSDSASGKSKGILFVSAKMDTKNKIQEGKNIKPYHKSFCDKIIVVKFAEKEHTNIGIIIIAIETS